MALSSRAMDRAMGSQTGNHGETNRGSLRRRRYHDDPTQKWQESWTVRPRPSGATGPQDHATATRRTQPMRSPEAHPPTVPRAFDDDPSAHRAPRMRSQGSAANAYPPRKPAAAVAIAPPSAPVPVSVAARAHPALFRPHP